MNKAGLRQTATPDLFCLEGRVALITGAGGYLGKAMSEALCQAGAHVIINGRTAEKIKELADKLTAKGYRVTEAVFDIKDENALQRLFDSIKEQHGKLDIIVNNAYAGRTGTVETATSDDFNEAYELTVTTAFRVVQLFLPLLKASKAHGGASVINISSMYGAVSPDPAIYGNSGSNNPPYYGPAKAALLQLSRYLACHLAQDGIRVNSISPGPFPPQDIAQKNPAFHQELCRKNPLQRIGDASELRGPLLFLASDAASYVTGANLPVDGGWTAW